MGLIIRNPYLFLNPIFIVTPHGGTALAPFDVGGFGPDDLHDGQHGHGIPLLLL